MQNLESIKRKKRIALMYILRNFRLSKWWGERRSYAELLVLQIYVHKNVIYCCTMLRILSKKDIFTENLSNILYVDALFL